MASGILVQRFSLGTAILCFILIRTEQYTFAILTAHSYILLKPLYSHIHEFLCYYLPLDGIVVRNISFGYLPESGNYVIRPDGPVENLLLNVQIFYDESVTGNITGETPLWKIFVWTSTSIDGGGHRYSLKRNVLRPRQSRQGLVVGQKLTFDRVRYPLNPNNLSCLEMSYVCVRFKMVAEKKYVILSRPNSSIRTECQPGPFCLPPSTFGKGEVD